MRRPYLLAHIGFSLCLFFQLGCSASPDFWKEARHGQKKILVTFPPLYCLTHAIAGDDAFVLCLLTSQGPHDYEGSAMDPVKVKYADLFIYNGLTLDDQFVENMLRNQKKSPPTLNVGEVMDNNHHELLLHGEEHQDGNGHKHQHGEHDPHIWLGPAQAMVMSMIIAEKLAAIDPSHKDGYANRAEKLQGEIRALEAHGKNAFKDKKNKAIITMHESLNYFAQAFDLEIVGTIQTVPGTDPDAASLARLAKLSREKQVKAFAVEPQYSTSQAETLQNRLKREKIDVTIVQIDPLETAPIPVGGMFNPDPSYYLTKMRENIDTLARVLP